MNDACCGSRAHGERNTETAKGVPNTSEAAMTHISTLHPFSAGCTVMVADVLAPSDPFARAAHACFLWLAPISNLGFLQGGFTASAITQVNGEFEISDA